MSRISSALCFLLVFFLAGARSHATDPGAPNLVLEGEVHPSQIKSYFEVPFIVPPGVHRITVSFHNLGRDQHTVLDLVVADPVRFRGNSGGNKDHFTIGESDATPSYLPGPIPSGRWKLL